ncbi:MAG TPA: hypothetical protein PLG66_13400, partial [Calditrichia bacterium]|nr:hypothetical protein [Calditrichia bacterium]
MLTEFFLLIIGLTMLWVGAELLVRYVSALARSVGVSHLVLGLTVVSLGTSLPELVVSVLAVLQGDDGISIGNIIGSNVANIALILGVGALIVPLGIRMDWIRRVSHPLGDVLQTRDSEASVLLSYFRNNVLHLFAVVSWLACCFLGNRRLSI